MLERKYDNCLYMPTPCFVTHACWPIDLERHTTLLSPMNMNHVTFVGTKKRFQLRRGVSMALQFILRFASMMQTTWNLSTNGNGYLTR